MWGSVGDTREFFRGNFGELWLIFVYFCAETCVGFNKVVRKIMNSAEESKQGGAVGSIFPHVIVGVNLVESLEPLPC